MGSVQNKNLTPFSRTVNRNFKQWIFKRHEGAGQKFTEEQMAWLRKIRDEIARSYRFEPEDFELMEQGALAKAYGVFGDDLYGLVDEMNEELVS